MKALSNYFFLVCIAIFFASDIDAQTTPKDSSTVKVYHLDKAVTSLKDSLQQQNDSLKRQIEALKTIVTQSFRQIESLEKEVGKSSENISESFQGLQKKIDSIPEKVISDKVKKEALIISTIPIYCGVQKYCILQKGAGGLYHLYIHDSDSLPSADSSLRKIKRYATESIVDAHSFEAWIKSGIQYADSLCPTSIAVLTEKVQGKIDKYKEQQIEDKNDARLKEQRKEVDSLTQLLVDFDRIAGQLELRDSIPIYKVGYQKRRNRHDQSNGITSTTATEKEESGKQGAGQENPKVRNTVLYQTPLGYLKLTKATVQIDNNRIFDISFTADAYGLNGEKIKSLNTIINNVFSLSFKGLNNREFSRIIQPGAYAEDALKDGFGFNYGDVINYAPRNSDFTPLVKNGTYNLVIDSATKIYRRRYSDYLSFRTFLDPLGFLGSNPNGFAQLEGDAVIPVNLRNYRITTWLPHVHANFSYIYNNTINSERRQASTILLANDSFSVFNPITQTLTRKTDSANYLYNLDIVRKAYYQLYIRGALVSWEIKKQNSWLNMEFGLRVFGSKVATISDTSTQHKIVPEMNLQWVLRPDNIFGGDLNVGLAFLGNMHRANNLPTSVDNPSFLWASSWAIPHELNIYVQTGKESKGGLFFRYNGWFSFNKQLAENIDERLLPSTVSKNKTGYFPQILFGYSTNLSTMIKRSGQDK